MLFAVKSILAAAQLLSMTTTLKPTAATKTEPQLVQTSAMLRNLRPTSTDSETNSSVDKIYNVFSSDQQELRWCENLDGPTRSYSISYSFLVQSSDEIDFDSIETALLSDVADQILDCRVLTTDKSSSQQTDEHTESRIVGLEVSTGKSGGGVSENFCKSGVSCHVVARKMEVSIEYGDDYEDLHLLAIAQESIEASLNSLSFKSMQVSYISDRPTLTRANSLRASSTPHSLDASSRFTVFTVSFISVVSVASLLAISFVLLRRLGNSNDRIELGTPKAGLDVSECSSITMQTLEDMNPSKTKRFSRAELTEVSVNLDVERFIVEDQPGTRMLIVEDRLEGVHWMHVRDDLLRSSNLGGFCIDLDTVAEEDEIVFDIEEGSI